jgi:hypothetical protein
VIATSTPVHAHAHVHAPIPESAFLNAEEQDAANEDGDSDDEYDLHGLGHAARRNAPAGALEPSAHMRQSRRRDRLANFVPRFFAPPVEPAPPPPYAGGTASGSANGNATAMPMPMSMPMPMPMFVPPPPGTGAPGASGAPNVAVAGVAPGVHISEAEMPTRPMPTLPTPFREEPPCYDVAAPLSPPLETSILGLGHGIGPGSIGSVGSLGSLGSIGSGGAAPAVGTFETPSVPPPAFDAAVTTGPPLRLVMPPTRVRGRSGAGTGTTPVVVGATPMTMASTASNTTA